MITILWGGSHLPTDGEIKDAIHLAEALARRRFAGGQRRQWLDDAIDAATGAVLRALKRYDGDRGFTPFARSFIESALRALAHRKSSQAKRRPQRQLLNDLGVSGAKLVDALIPADMLIGLTALQQNTLTRKYTCRESFAEIGRARGVSKQSAKRCHDRAIKAIRKKTEKSKI